MTEGGPSSGGHSTDPVWWDGKPMNNAAAAVDAAAELREAARQFHNLTQGDPAVIIRPPNAEKRDAIVAAGERLRAAIAGAKGPTPSGWMPTYRLLTPADMIQKGDECLSDDTVTWVPLAGWEIGMRWHNGLMPMRRRT